MEGGDVDRRQRPLAVPRAAYIATSAGSGAGFTTTGSIGVALEAGGGVSTGATPSGMHPANEPPPARSEARIRTVMSNTHSGNE